MRRPNNATTKVLIGTFVVGLLALVVAAGVWRTQGGRWFDVRTASMGTAAPVGTLLLTRPVELGDVEKGDLITFHAPGSGAVYSHRAVAVSAGGVQTRGDINPVRDTWTLHQADLVGKVVWQAPALGWLLRGLPLLLLCAAAVGVVASLVRRSRRGPVRLLGASASFAVVGYVLHPWVGLERISSHAAGEGVVLRVISTGLFPVKVSAVRGTDSAHLIDGAVGDVHVSNLDSHQAYSLATNLSLNTWWWIGLVLVCLAPLLWSLVVGLEPVPDDETDDQPDDPPDEDLESEPELAGVSW